jgi:hypothetical protein
MLALPRRGPDGIAYAVLGDSGPHVLAVHGGPGMDHVYVPSAFRLVYFDLPGRRQHLEQVGLQLACADCHLGS